MPIFNSSFSPRSTQEKADEKRRNNSSTAVSSKPLKDSTILTSTLTSKSAAYLSSESSSESKHGNNQPILDVFKDLETKSPSYSANNFAAQSVVKERRTSTSESITSTNTDPTTSNTLTQNPPSHQNKV